MSGDKTARRHTPLAAKLKERIRESGPITVSHYMQACLFDGEHGYYRSQQAIGAAGDFITAPEISQVFGELIGLWCAVTWQTMGSPAKLDLIELGPGRGTMMRDALRAGRIVPGFLEALRIHLVESNSVLVSQQRGLLAPLRLPCTWHSSLESLTRDDGRDASPAILLANEFLDTCPVSQSVVTGGALRTRGVGLGADGELAFVMLDEHAAPAPLPPLTLREGDIVETQDFAFMRDIARLAAKRPKLAGLFIDYGHTETLAGDTLQAVRRHTAEHPLTSPGEADLTVHVDFAAFQRAMDSKLAKEGRRGLLVANGPITQAEFLGRLGIMQRASRLMAANPNKAHVIEAAVARLMAPSGMGSRFKAIALTSPGLAPLPGFQ